jgi:hypothetical protein
MEAFAPATISCRNIVFMKIQIGEWLPGQTGTASLQQDIHILADVLRAIVHMGPGVTFVVPFSIDDASAFWAEEALPGVRAGTRRVLVARDQRREDRSFSAISAISALYV